MKRKSIMKRLAMMGGVALTALCLYVMPALAAPLPSYVGSGTCGDNAEWSLDTEGNLKIWGTGTINNGNWDSLKNQIRTVTIGEGVTCMDWTSFSGSSNLTTVKLPTTLTSIERSAFSDCTSLKSINIPKKMQTLGTSVFYGCKSLEKITLPEGLKSMHGDVFRASGLKEITIPSTLTYDRGNSFSDCTQLERAVINSPMVAYYSFSNCYNLKTVVIGNNVTYIDKFAFKECKNLSKVTFGNNLKNIYASAFYNCDSLTEINLPDSLQHLYGSTIGEYYGIFENCDRLQTVTIGTDLAEMISSFMYCPSLKTVYFCGDAPKFTNEPFRGCGNLTVYVPEYAVDTTWTASVRNPQGAASIDWQTWIPPVSHFAPKAGSAANGASKVTVTWKALPGASKYEVLRKTGTGAYSVIGATAKTTYTDTTAKSNGMKYTYKIRAIGSNNVKSRTSAAMVTIYTARPAISKIAYAGAGKLTVSYKRNTAASGYQIQYAANSKFTSAKTVTVKSGKTVSATLKSLTKGKKYYIRMRTYKTSSGKNYYSAWSAAKAVTAK